MMITKEECFAILDKHIKSDVSKFWTDALDKTDLHRFTTQFMPFSFEDKLKQYYFTSRVVCFGNALEEIFHCMLEKNGAIFLDRHYVAKHDCDQLFSYLNKTVLIEQKVRDDHDSSKKTGQIVNFQAKKNALSQDFDEFYCTSWFIDDGLKKNRSYYLSQLTDPYELCYGAEIEDFLEMIFGDDRAKGFVDILGAYLDEYQQYATNDILDNIYIDYTALQPKTLYNLLSAKNRRNEIAHYFFQDNIPYEDMLKTYKAKRKNGYIPQVITLLEEILNGKTV